MLVNVSGAENDVVLEESQSSRRICRKGIDAAAQHTRPSRTPLSALQPRMFAVRALTSQKATKIVVFGSPGLRKAGWKRLTLPNVKLVRSIMTTVHSFDIEPIARFAGLNAGIRRPKEIACFSYDDKHQFRPDASSLRYYYPPCLPADLNRGFETFQQLDDTKDDHLDGLVDTIAALEKEKGAKVEADIITWRGMMTKIMAVPYSPMDGWEMNATCFQGSIFLEENHGNKLSSKEVQHSQPTRPGAPSQDVMSYWGYKFETLSLLPQPWYPTAREYIESREDQVVSNYAQYCSVVRTGYGKMKMIIGGEVDAVWDVKPDDKNLPINWVELKTSDEVISERDQVKFERKLLKFWIQSFLLGVPKIVVGFRTADGILQRLEEFDTQSIPDMVKSRGRNLWDGNTCINFAANFLEWLKSVITEDGVWRVRKQGKVPRLEVFKLEDSGHGDILSENFVQWRTFGLPGSREAKGSLSQLPGAIKDHANVTAAT